MKKRIDVILIILLFIGCLCLMFSCKTNTVYVPGESIKTEFKDVYLKDSVYLLDSVFVDRFIKEDTVFITKEKYKYLYRDKIKADSIFRTDSIAVPYPVKGDTVYVNELRWWQKGFIAIGFIAVMVLIGFIAYRIKR